MKRLITIISAITIMLCLGGVYAFSIFVPPLMSSYGLTTTQTQIIFGLTIASFSIAMLFSNKLLVKLGFKKTALLGALLFCLGYIIASISDGNVLILTFGIGLIAGASISFGYVCSLTLIVQWLPNNKGLATGISVAGFGCGAIILSQLVEILLVNGLDVLEIFRLIGIIYGTILILSTLGLSTPVNSASDNLEKNTVTLNNSELFKDKRFWALVCGMFAGTFSGLLIIGNLKPIGLYFQIDEQYATLAIGLFAIGNTTGRLIWGYLADTIGTRLAIVLALLFLAFSVILLSVLSTTLGFIILSILIGFGFGANFVLFATGVIHTFSVQRLGFIYPYVFLAYGFAAILGPFIGGWLFDLVGNFQTSMIIAAVVSICGVLFYAYLTMQKKEKIIRSKAGIS
jgi:OFA family oxalate/formate antiporter-like MFS transporter